MGGDVLARPDLSQTRCPCDQVGGTANQASNLPQKVVHQLVVVLLAFGCLCHQPDNLWYFGGDWTNLLNLSKGDEGSGSACSLGRRRSTDAFSWEQAQRDDHRCECGSCWLSPEACQDTRPSHKLLKSGVQNDPWRKRALTCFSRKKFFFLIFVQAKPKKQHPKISTAMVGYHLRASNPLGDISQIFLTVGNGPESRLLRVCPDLDLHERSQSQIISKMRQTSFLPETPRPASLRRFRFSASKRGYYSHDAHVPLGNHQPMGGCRVTVMGRSAPRVGARQKAT